MSLRRALVSLVGFALVVSACGPRLTDEQLAFVLGGNGRVDARG